MVIGGAHENPRNHPMSGPVAREIEILLQEAFLPTRLDVINDSARHHGHAGDDGSGESHFTVVIESVAFAARPARAPAHGQPRARRYSRRTCPRAGDLARSRRESGRMSDLETDHPVTHDLGGFQVRRAVPSPECRMVGPFVFVDQFGPARLAPARAWTCARTRTSTSPR
jgi:hypothetical protein